MRHYMVDPDNEERLLKVPPRVVYDIKAEAYNAAWEAVVAMPYDEPEDDEQSREHEVEVRQRYLTAIDALRKEPND